MVFLTETLDLKIPEAKRLAQARLSKLSNLKLHLKQLLAKKLRLELEIKHVTTVIKKKSKQRSKELRLTLNLEQGMSLDQFPLRSLRYEALSPELIDLLKEGDQIARELIDILEEEELVTQEELQDLEAHL